MPGPFYITQDERQMLSQVPPALTKKWEGSMQDETLTSYETQEELADRLSSVSYDEYPAAKTAAQLAATALQDGGDLSKVLASFPEEAMPTFLYSIGASGIEAIIQLSLLETSLLNERTMEALAALSRARHHLLEQNAGVTA